MAVVLGGLTAIGVVVDKALPHELINVDFSERVEPFDLASDSFARYNQVEGTLVLRTEVVKSPIISVGRFVRTAYAVGVRAEFVEMTGSGTFVGAMCLGPDSEHRYLSGYGFFVEPGGAFILGRQDPVAGGGRIEFLKQGTVPGIETLERVSITCVPSLGGDVALTGYANGLEIVTADDPDGYSEYTHAGLAVVGMEEAGTEVRFTRVWARLPDGQWTP